MAQDTLTIIDNRTQQTYTCLLYTSLHRDGAGKWIPNEAFQKGHGEAVSYTHLDVYKRQRVHLRR